MWEVAALPILLAQIVYLNEAVEMFCGRKLLPVQWPRSWVYISSWVLSAFKGPGHRLTSRRASFLKSVFAGGQVRPPFGTSLLVASSGVHAQTCKAIHHSRFHRRTLNKAGKLCA